MAEREKIDPLYRVIVYPQQRFRTTDGRYYQRVDGDTIRRQIPKVRGKAARRADKLTRRKR